MAIRYLADARLNKKITPKGAKSNDFIAQTNHYKSIMGGVYNGK